MRSAYQTPLRNPLAREGAGAPLPQRPGVGLSSAFKGGREPKAPPPPIFAEGHDVPLASESRGLPAGGPFSRHQRRLAAPRYAAGATLDPDGPGDWTARRPGLPRSRRVDIPQAPRSTRAGVFVHRSPQDCFVEMVMRSAELARGRTRSCCGPSPDQYRCNIDPNAVQHISGLGLVLPTPVIRDGRLFTSEFVNIARRGTFNFEVNTHRRRRMTNRERDFFLYCVSFLIANLEWVRFALTLSIPRGNWRDKNWFAELRDEVLLRETTGPRVFKQRIDVQMAVPGTRICAPPGRPSVFVSAFANRGCFGGCNLTFCPRRDNRTENVRLLPFVAGSEGAISAVRGSSMDDFSCLVVRASGLILHEFLHMIDFKGHRNIAGNDVPEACFASYVFEANWLFLAFNYLKVVEGIGRCQGRCSDWMVPRAAGCGPTRGTRFGCPFPDGPERRDEEGAGLWHDYIEPTS